MSKLEELIRTLCPDGVEYIALKDVSIMRRGTAVTKKDVVAGDIPVISGGKEPAYFCSEFNRDGETITVAGSGVGAGFVNYWDTPIFVADSFSIKGNNTVKTKYLYHVLLSMQSKIYATQTGGGIPHVHISSIENFLIPVPPLEVQREIVRILDNFTELTSELTSELTAELEFRQKQYEHYRDLLLSFDDISLYRERVIYRSLGSLGSFYGGLSGKSKGDFENGNAKFITYRNVYSNPALNINVDDKVKISEGEKQNVLQYGDVIFTGSSETQEECGFSSVVTVKPEEKMYLNSFCFFFRFYDPSIMLPGFAKYLFRSGSLRSQICMTANGVTRYNVSKKLMEKIIIPIPPLELQQEIADRLDRFYTLCSDITSGLPAEIAARQKQYEYYRDQLLSFRAACI